MAAYCLASINPCPNERATTVAAILEDTDWSTWLGETEADPDSVKAVLKTMEGVDWQIRREPKKPRPAKPERPPTPDLGPGLF